MLLLIEGQEENYWGEGYSPVFNNTFPLTHAHTHTFYLALHNISTQVQCQLPDLGL